MLPADSGGHPVRPHCPRSAGSTAGQEGSEVLAPRDGPAAAPDLALSRGEGKQAAQPDATPARASRGGPQRASAWGEGSTLGPLVDRVKAPLGTKTAPRRSCRHGRRCASLHRVAALTIGHNGPETSHHAPVDAGHHRRRWSVRGVRRNWATTTFWTWPAVSVRRPVAVSSGVVLDVVRWGWWSRRGAAWGAGSLGDVVGGVKVWVVAWERTDRWCVVRCLGLEKRAKWIGAQQRSGGAARCKRQPGKAGPAESATGCGSGCAGVGGGGLGGCGLRRRRAGAQRGAEQTAWGHRGIVRLGALGPAAHPGRT